ncbi:MULTISPECIES: helix-turn-helix domain-containing protein [Pseudomonas]|uniref:helix-turn-helix domain-containing protein n=1 Tax=Pseudomonas sp. FG1 TaxID=3048624 RepID=UPI00211DD8EA|nr:helix-turn-helix domain-containing protein [Pseudomonas sp. FG1]MDY7551918.1 helix-turn-helix domain-containing protein [Pseudomonas sp. FG1]MEB0054163.1 helix-turn-helix domain-containing protein [Pseudomonas sp. FG1]
MKKPKKKNFIKNDAWILKNNRTLTNSYISIALTNMEYRILDLLARHLHPVISTHSIIEHLKKEPDQYKGLFMSISRLQRKFKSASNGERLIISVRNRGYCLTQKIIIDTDQLKN